MPPHVVSRLDWARRSFVPSGYRKLEALARAKAPAIAAGKEFAVMQRETARDRLFTDAGLTGMDASEAAFLVLAMATKDMDDDLRMIMAEIKATNDAKQKMREQIKALNRWISEEMGKASSSSDINNANVTGRTRATGTRSRLGLEKASSPLIRLEYVKAPVVPPLPPRNSNIPVATLKARLDDIQGQLDSLNELSEMTSLRLQMTMDRRSKFISTLSNIMKKESSTQDILVQNIK